MQETRKANARRLKEPIFQRVFRGIGIDIGCGTDVLDKRVFKDIVEIQGFDTKDGDAGVINKYKTKGSYDFVYSSNCLEHLESPFEALENWFSLLKIDGYLIFTVPDEDLYEQGIFPSHWNIEHKHTFAIFKKNSWSAKSINIFDLVASLHNCRVMKISIVDDNYNYNMIGADQTSLNAEAFIEVILQKVKDEYCWIPSHLLPKIFPKQNNHLA
jgi:SAM-dependent methyltransferase